MLSKIDEQQIKLFHNRMDNTIRSCLQEQNFLVVALDNNQKGHQVKFQRNGKSNNFVRVSAQMHKKCILFVMPENVRFDPHEAYHCSIGMTYIDQNIPSPFRIPPFEKVRKHNRLFDTLGDGNPRKEVEFIRSMKSNSASYSNEGTVDTSGNRVRCCASVIFTCNFVENVVAKNLSNYISCERRWKPWKDQPLVFQSKVRKNIAKSIHEKISWIRKTCSPFHSSTIKITNPSITDES